MSRKIYFIYSIAIALLLGLMIGCAESGTNATRHKKKLSPTDSLINSGGLNAQGDFAKGAQLIAHNDCFTCHRVDKQIYGPSFHDMVAKYQYNEGNVNKLAYGIMHGSKGIWGTDLSMVPHTNVTPQEAELMVRYILTLDTSAIRK